MPTPITSIAAYAEAIAQGPWTAICRKCGGATDDAILSPLCHICAHDAADFLPDLVAENAKLRAMLTDAMEAFFVRHTVPTHCDCVSCRRQRKAIEAMVEAGIEWKEI